MYPGGQIAPHPLLVLHVAHVGDGVVVLEERRAVLVVEGRTVHQLQLVVVVSRLGLNSAIQENVHLRNLMWKKSKESNLVREAFFL